MTPDYFLNKEDILKFLVSKERVNIKLKFY